MIAALQEESAQIKAQVAALVDSDEALAQTAELLQTMVGVGRSRARRLLYQAAAVAVAHDARWRAVSEGLLAKWKAKRVSWRP